MMFLLAQTSTALDGEYFLKFFLVVGFVLSVVGNAVQVTNARRSQKREVTLNGECADKKEFTEHVNRNREGHADLYGKITRSAEAIREEVRRDVDKLRDRIDECHIALKDEVGELRSEVSAVKKESELQTEHLIRIEGKLP